jgi:nucleoside-diphosphate-sugar epimerase
MDAVVHLAVALRSGEPDGWAEVAAAMPETNTDAAVALATEALEAGVPRFVHVSTNLVYGSDGDRPFVEDDPLRPSDVYAPYSLTKAAAERGLAELHRSAGLGLRIVRLAFVYGEGDPHLAEAMRWATNWAPHQRLHVVHHADVAQGLLLALHAEGIDGRAYNVADDAPVTAYELAALQGQCLPGEAPSRAVEHPWEGVVSTMRISTELGYRPIYPTLWSAWHAGAL